MSKPKENVIVTVVMDYENAKLKMITNAKNNLQLLGILMQAEKSILNESEKTQNHGKESKS